MRSRICRSKSSLSSQGHRFPEFITNLAGRGSLLVMSEQRKEDVRRKVEGDNESAAATKISAPQYHYVLLESSFARYQYQP
jgi:hypothetical protein